MKDLSGKVAAVTGAGSGIGRMLAANLAKEGCSVAISDIDQTGLDRTTAMIDNKDIKVTTHRVNVADRDQVYQYAKDVVKQHGKVNLLINNAGVAVSETLEDVTYEDFEWLIGINLWGVVYGCKAFLPYLKQQPEAHIANMSSVNGIFTNPNVGTYCTSKFAIRGFTEALAQELKYTPVGVSCVHPGGIKTDIVRHTRFYKTADPEMSREETIEAFDKYVAWTSADKAARIIISGIKKNKLRIMVGPDAYIYDWLKRLFPVGFQWLMGLGLKKH